MAFADGCGEGVGLRGSGSLACSAVAEARSGVFSDVGDRDGRSGRPRGVAALPLAEDRPLFADDVEGVEGGDDPGEGLDAPRARRAAAVPTPRGEEGGIDARSRPHEQQQQRSSEPSWDSE